MAIQSVDLEMENEPDVLKDEEARLQAHLSGQAAPRRQTEQVSEDNYPMRSEPRSGLSGMIRPKPSLKVKISHPKGGDFEFLISELSFSEEGIALILDTRLANFKPVVDETYVLVSEVERGKERSDTVVYLGGSFPFPQHHAVMLPFLFNK